MTNITLVPPRANSCPPPTRLHGTTPTRLANSSLEFDSRFQQLTIQYPSPSNHASPSNTPPLTPIVAFLDDCAGMAMTSEAITQIHTTVQEYVNSIDRPPTPLTDRLSPIIGRSETFLSVVSTNFNYMSTLHKETHQPVYCPQFLGTIARDLATSKVLNQQTLFKNIGDTLTYVTHENSHSYIHKARSDNQPPLPQPLAHAFNEAHTCEQRNLFLIPPHEHIIPFYGLAPKIDPSSTLYPLLIAYASGGDLFYSLSTDTLAPKDLLILAKQIAKGLLHLHSHGIIYLDLKLENIVIDAKGNARIIDFGFSHLVHSEEQQKVFEENQPIHLPKGGTINYYPPEFCLHSTPLAPTSAKTDIWAFGHILYEMLDRQHDLLYYLSSELKIPYPEGSIKISEALKTFFKKHPKPQEFIYDCVNRALTARIADLGEIAHLLGDIAKECLNLDFKQRPTITNIIKKLSSIN